MKHIVVFLIFFSFFFYIHSGSCAVANSTAVNNIVVDVSSRTGKISKSVFGISTNPTEIQKKWAPLKEAGFKFIEVNVLVDEKLISIVKKNPELIGKLPFVKILDIHIQKTYEIGAEPLIWFLYHDKPIKDLEGLANYTRCLIKHLNEGFAGGGKWPISFFRFGNEPDNPQYWKGTPEQFYNMYTVWAKTVKQMNPHFVVVGPSIVTSCERDPKNVLDCSRVNKWTRDFLNYLAKNKGALDYFTFHGYSPVVYEIFYRQPIALSQELRKYPSLSPLYGVPKIGNDEWNVRTGDEWSGKYHEEFDTVSLAAHNIAALTAMIQAGVELSIRYGGTDSSGHDYVMVKKGQSGYKPVYYAFKGFNMLASTPVKLQVLNGSNFLNFTTLAGKSEDGNEITVLISSFDISNYIEKYENGGSADSFRQNLIEQHFKKALASLNVSTPPVYTGIKLHLKNLGWKTTDMVNYSLYAVKDDSGLLLQRNQRIKGDKELSIVEDLKTPSVIIIRLKRL